MSNMDRLSPPRRVHSIRRHAAYVCQVRRDNGRTHARKSSLANVTEAALRRSIIEILSHSQEEANLAASELAETMDSVFFAKGAGAGAVPRAKLAPAPDLVDSEVAPLHAGYPAKCVTVVTHEHEKSPSNRGLLPRARRKPLLVMEKLSKHRQQRSLPTIAPRKVSVDDESSLGHRSKGLASKLSRAVLRNRKPSTSTLSSEKGDFRPPSRLSGTLSSLGSSLKQSFSLTRAPDLGTPTISTRMLDSEKASYEQIVYRKHDLAVGYPLIDSPMVQVEQELTPFRDSAYYSKASDASEDCLTTGWHASDTTSAHASCSTPKRPHMSKGASISTLSPALTPPIVRSPLTPHTPLTPSYNTKLQPSSARPSPSHYHLTPPPPLRRPALHHSSSLPTLTVNTTVNTSTAAATTYTPRSAQRPRFDRFLSTTSMWSDAASSSYSPTTSKPPTPLRERPFLDLKQRGRHKRVLSSGSRTESIRIYLDEEEDEEGERDEERAAEEEDKMKESRSEGVQWSEVQWNKRVDTETSAAEALRELDATTVATGTFTLSSPLLRAALATDIPSTSATSSSKPTDEPLTLAPLTFKKKPLPIHLHRRFPDVPYAPDPSPPGSKWYDIYATAHSRQPAWEGPWTRRCGCDAELVELFEAGNFTQGKVARRVVGSGVARDGVARNGPQTPVEMAVCGNDKCREREERVRRGVEDYLSGVKGSHWERSSPALALS